MLVLWPDPRKTTPPVLMVRVPGNLISAGVQQHRAAKSVRVRRQPGNIIDRVLEVGGVAPGNGA